MAVHNRDFLKNKNRTFDNILDSIQTQADHLRHEGTVPTIAATTAGDGTCAISAESTDVAGTVTFADTWGDGDTLDRERVRDILLQSPQFTFGGY